MIKIELYKDAVPEPLAQQIIRMAVLYTTELGTDACPPDHPLYVISQIYLGFELHAYLSAIGHPGGGNGELLVAFDDEHPGTAIGFLLYMPITDSVNSCGVNYGAVREASRGRGIFTALVRKMLSRYPLASLSCFVESVPLYERLGFRVEVARSTQVQMTTDPNPGDQTMTVIDLSRLQGHPVVIQAHEDALAKHGHAAIAKASNEASERVDSLFRKAETFVKDRLLNSPTAGSSSC